MNLKKGSEAPSGSDYLCLPTAASVITTAPEDTQALVGRSATFTCAAEAEPVPTFQWDFDSSILTDTNKYDIITTSTMSTLIVLDITPSDDGTYTCNVTNDHGSDFASANLQVLCKLQAEYLHVMNQDITTQSPPLSLRAAVPLVTAVSSSPLTGTQGTSVTLQFSVSDDLPSVNSSDIVWRFTPFGSSAMQLNASNERYIFSDNMLSLTIGGLAVSDEGRYTLEATTIAGSSSATIFLDVQSTRLYFIGNTTYSSKLSQQQIFSITPYYNSKSVAFIRMAQSLIALALVL